MPESYVKLTRSEADAIADAVRAKAGTAAAMTASETAAAITALQTMDTIDIIDCGTSTTVIS